MSPESDSVEINTLADRIVSILINKILPIASSISNACNNIANSFIFKLSVFLIIFTNSILLCFYQDYNEFTLTYLILESIFLLLFIAESVIKNLSEGCHVYLSDTWNKFDLIQIIVSIICLFPSIQHNPYIIWYRCLRPLRIVTYIPELKAIVHSVSMSIREMFNVLILLLFVYLLYAVLAVNLWSGIFSRRCRVDSEPREGHFLIEKNNDMICGGLLQCSHCKSIAEYYDKEVYLLSERDINDEMDVDALNYGYSNFDNFFAAFLTIYHSMTLQGWSKIMYMVQNGYSYSASSVYFITLVVILNFLVLNFLIAILMNNIEINMKLNHCEEQFKVKLVDLESEAKKILKKEISLMNLLKKFTFLIDFLKTLKINTDIRPQYIHHLKYKLTFYCYAISVQPFWDYINYIIIIVNMVYLSKQDENTTALNVLSILTIVFFNIDWILKLMGLGIKKFFSDYQNMLNSAVSVVCIFEYIFFSSTVLSVVKLINVLNIVYALKDFKDFQIILFLLHKTISSIGYFFILIVVLVYIFALIGITLFKGAFDNTELPRKNFDAIGTSMKLVFSLMIGDDWYIAMISFLRAKTRSKIAIYMYFILTNMLLSILMMNLVVAFLVYHFEQARMKQKYKELVGIIKQAEKSVGYKRSLSFSYFCDTKLQREFDSDILEIEDDILNMSDLFDYELMNDEVLIKDEIKANGHSSGVNLAKVIHDVNTDRILSMDNFGFGNILRKIKMKKANTNNTTINITNTTSKQNVKSSMINNNNNENAETVIEKKKSSKRVSYFIKPLEQLNIPINVDEDNKEKEFYANQCIERDNLIDMIKDKRNILNNAFHVKTIRKISGTKINNYMKQFEKTNIIRNTNCLRRKSVYGSKNTSKGRGNALLTITPSNRNEKSVNTSNINFNSTSMKIDNHRVICMQKPKSLQSIMNPKSNLKKKLKVITHSKCFLYISQSSLCIFHRKSFIRKICIKITNSTLFNVISLLFVIMSCIVIMLDTPYVDSKSTKKKILFNLDATFTIIFMVEMSLRIIAVGLLFKDADEAGGPCENKQLVKLGTMSSSFSSSSQSSCTDTENEKSKNNSKISFTNNQQKNLLSNNTYYSNNTKLNYIGVNVAQNQNKNKQKQNHSTQPVIIKPPYLRNLFNIIDCCVIITNLLSFIKSRDYQNQHHTTSFIYLRALRPLRMISNFVQLRQVVQALILSIPSIIYMILIAFVVFFVYSVIGHNYFKYLLGECDLERYNTKTKCEKHGGVWTSNEENFDTISSSMLIVYELASTSGWYDIMEDIVLQTNNFSSFYFVSFMIIGSIFIMNFSVTCVVNTFIALREKLEGNAFLTDEQKEWVKSVKMLMKFKPIPMVDVNSPKISSIRKICYKISQSKLFIVFININIFLNIATMCLTHNRQDEIFEKLQSYMFYVATFFFVCEMLIKIIAFKALFFIDPMNKFDFVVVILSSVSVILSICEYYLPNSKYFDDNYDFFPGLMRGIRILRVFRLINLNFSIKNYLKILLFLFPQLINIVSLILVNIVAFSILGIHLFSTVKYGDVINDNCNFKDIISSFVLLMRVITGDEWNDIMHELALKQPDCVENQTYDSLMKDGPMGCGKWVSYPFFISFMILNSMVIINMFIAVIVGTFIEENVDQSKNELSIKEAKEFYTLWSKYDNKVSYSIELSQFVLFMIELDYPMGLKGDKLFSDFIYKKELKGKIYTSKDNSVMIDESQCISILDKLGVVAKNGKIHILDAIKLISKRYIIANKEKEDINNLENYKHELKMLDIKHKKIGEKLKERFKSYHRMYDKMDNELSSKAMAKSIICKFVKEWKTKRKNAKKESKRNSSDKESSNRFWEQYDYDYNYNDFEFIS